MNSYKKFRIYLILFFILIPYKSRTPNFISIGPAISAGSKSFPINGQLGLGGSIEYVRSISAHGAVRLYAGYDYFKHRFPESGSQDSLLNLEAAGYGTNTLLPIRIGYQHFLYKNVSFLYGEASMSVLHRPTLHKRADFTKNLFTYAFGFVQRFTIRQQQIIQLSIFYNYNRLYSNRNLNYFSLRAAYGLIFRRAKSNASIK